MGRLSRRVLRGWSVPVLLTLALLVGVHARVKADPAPSTSELSVYLQTHQLDAYSQPQDQYQQVFYNFGDQHIQLSNTNYDHVSVVFSGQYVAWTGLLDDGSQIFLYDVLNNTLLQLTSAGTNQSPFLYNGTVTWQHWDGDSWQVFYYNGTTVQQITTAATSSVRATTNGQQILYAQILAPNSWQAITYDIATGNTAIVRQGDEASTAYPQFVKGGGITTGFLD
jgi:hypothetical protein